METFIKNGSIKTLYTTPKIQITAETLDKKSGASCREKERERVGGRLRNLLKIFYTLEKFGLLTIFWLFMLHVLCMHLTYTFQGVLRI